MPDRPAFEFSDVLQAELDEIATSRRARGLAGSIPRHDDPLQRAHRAQLIGLAFSGGGIRSATFNLGVLQALANLNLLRCFDYLSTVSGGGYIGSWLNAWLRQASFGEVMQALRTDRRDESGADARARPAEPAQIRFLRRYSSYLTPRRGLFSADAMTLVSTYLRNFILNLIVLGLLLAICLFVPRLLTGAYAAVAAERESSLFWWVFGLLWLAIGSVSWKLSSLVRARDGATPVPRQTGNASLVSVYALIVAPVLAASWLVAAWLWQQRESPLSEWYLWAFWTAVLYVTVWAFGSTVTRMLRKLRSAPAAQVYENLKALRDIERCRQVGGVAIRWAVVLIAAAAAGAMAGPLLLLLAQLLNWIAVNYPDGSLWHASVWCLPLVLQVFALAAVLHIGLTGHGFSEEAREWWSRLGAVTTIAGGVWITLFVIAIYGPWFFDSLGERARAWVSGALASGWLGTSLIGVLLGRRDENDTRRLVKWLRPLIVVAPYVFVAGLLLALAWLIQRALPDLVPALAAYGNAASGWGERAAVWLARAWVDGAGAGSDYWARMDLTLSNALPAVTATATALLLVFAWRVGVNEFSIHAAYGNRLVRAYLGASNMHRRAERFTGFDPQDGAVHMEDLCPSRGHVGPYPIVNTTLNLVHGEELAWQQRKATSFVFTPKFCGCDAMTASAAADAQVRRCYVSTKEYAGGPSLAKAMTISGAAASPSMGYATSRGLAFLMTVFNIRLGWWLGNPCHRSTWKSDNPSFALWCLLSELLGLTNSRSRYVYLSDGGHFENLALYELVRRRCRYILVCDAACDPTTACRDLANAIEKCRTDFGIEISIDIEAIRADRACCRVGTIHYRRRDGKDTEDGVLVYLKSALMLKREASEAEEGPPLYVSAYKSGHAQFPHETTADQWFTESQFEAYRGLGQYLTESVLKTGVARKLLEDTVDAGAQPRRTRRTTARGDERRAPGMRLAT